MDELAKGAAHQLGDALDLVDVGSPFGDAAIVVHRIEVGRHLRAGRGHAAGQQQQGDGIGVGLGRAAERVFSSRPGLHGEDAKGAAIRRAAKAVGHVDARPLLAADNGPDASACGLVNQRLSGKSRQPLDAFGLEDVGNGLVAVHGHGVPFRVLWLDQGIW